MATVSGGNSTNKVKVSNTKAEYYSDLTKSYMEKTQEYMEICQINTERSDEQYQEITAILEDLPTRKQTILDEITNLSNDKIEDIEVATEEYKTAAIEEMNAVKTENAQYTTLSRDWATKTDGKVVEDDVEVDYSSKYYAQQAASEHTTALSDITSAKTTAQTAIETAKESAVSEINTTKTTAVTDISTDKTQAQTAIQTDKETALTSITTAQNTAISNIQATGFYMRDGKLYYTENGEEKEFNSTSAIGRPIFCLPEEGLDNNEIWLEGAEVSKTTYAELYAVYGDSYGTPENADNFVLPDFRGRTLWGSEDGTAGYLAAGLPNITGKLNVPVVYNQLYCLQNGSGAFVNSTTNIKFNEFNSSVTTSRGTTSGDGNYLNASLSSAVYGNSDTVQPPAIKVRIKTKYK